jgi:hypothetical protein
MGEILITISKDGSKITTEAAGFSGESCLDATNKLIENLGEKTQTDLKQEYYEQEHLNLKA